MITKELVKGHLRKMTAQLVNPVEYQLVLDDQQIDLKPFLGQDLTLEYQGEIHCIQCGRKTNKSFQQGHCFPCMRRLMECNNCIIHPEKCNVEQGTCPQDDWAHAHCNQPHIVYLANSSGLKVGITRETQIPTRWIDQGAGQALAIFRVSNRYQSGMIEVCLKQFVADRTDWRKMLKGVAAPIDLIAARDQLLAEAAKPLQQTLAQFKTGDIQAITDSKVQTIHYPVTQYLEKIKSFSFDKTPQVEGKLLGIKGQYLIFDSGVINLRKFSGYLITIKN